MWLLRDGRRDNQWVTVLVLWPDCVPFRSDTGACVTSLHVYTYFLTVTVNFILQVGRVNILNSLYLYSLQEMYKKQTIQLPTFKSDYFYIIQGTSVLFSSRREACSMVLKSFNIIEISQAQPLLKRQTLETWTKTITSHCGDWYVVK